MKTTKILERINLSMIVINFFLLQSYLVRFHIGPYPSNLQEILVITNLITFLGIIIKKREIKTLKHIFKYKIILTLISLSLISLIVVNINDTISAIRHMKFLMFASIFTFIFLESIKTKKERWKVIEWGALGAITFGIFSIIWNATGHNQTHDLRLNGPLNSAVSMAFYMAPFFIFTAIQYIKTREKRFLLEATALLVMIILTKSMGAYMGITATIALFIGMQKKDLLKNKIIKFGLISTILIVVVTIFITKILPSIQTNYSSLDERGQIWKTTKALMFQPENAIFGLGVGQFEYQYKTNVQDVLHGEKPLDFNNPHPHNIFLLFWTEYGFLGLFLIIKLLYLTTKKLRTEEIANYILLYFFIHGLIDSPFFKNDMLILFLMFSEIMLMKNKKITEKHT